MAHAGEHLVVQAPMAGGPSTSGDAESFDRWAGQAHRLSRAAPAVDVVAALTPG